MIRKYEFEGRVQTTAEWASEWGIARGRAGKRLKAYRKAKATGRPFTNFKLKRPCGFKQDRKPCAVDIATFALPGEQWRPVVGWERFYLVSDLGRVRSLHQKGRFVIGMPMDRGYRVLKVRDCERRGHIGVHVMVLEAFVGPRPEGMEGCHNDGEPANNKLSNLRWDTPVGNAADKVLHGTNNARGTDILTPDLVRQIRSEPKTTDVQWALRIGCTRTTIISARTGKTWSDVDVPPLRKRA